MRVNVKARRVSVNGCLQWGGGGQFEGVNLVEGGVWG